MQPVARNPIDAVWTDRPAAAAGPRRTASAGLRRPSAPRRSASRSPRCCATAKQDAAVISDPASIAWLLNIRGGDVPFTPFALGFAHRPRRWRDRAVHGPGEAARGDARLARQHGVGGRARRAGAGACAAGRQERAGRFRRLAGLVRPDAARGGRRLSWPAPDPCLLPKARKNDVEQQGARNAHARDAVAVCRFLHLLAETGPRGRETEMSAAAQLLDLRQQVAGLPRRKLPRDLRRGRARRDHPLPRHRGRPIGRSVRTRST